MKKIMNRFYTDWLDILVGFFTIMIWEFWKRILNISSATTAVYGFYILLVVTPFIGTLFIVSYIYDEMMGFIKIHFENCKSNPDPFFIRVKPGLENNILHWLFVLVLNTFVMGLLFS